MLDDDGNVRTIESKSRNIIEEEELNYPILLSVNHVNAYINYILANSHENDDSIKQTICHHGAEPNAQMMDNEINNWVINGKIFMAIGSNNKPCPLFSTTPSQLEDRFTSQISSILANNKKGASASVLQKIWGISPEQAKGVIE